MPQIDMQAKHPIRIILLLLGALLLVMPVTFGYVHSVFCISDFVSGLLLIFFGTLAIDGRRTWAAWVCCFVGLWLQFAPLLFWAPNAVIYVSDTFIGLLAIAFSILVPGARFEEKELGACKPLGWSYNPSSWVQRMPIITLAFLSWFLSRFLAAFQLGYIHTMPDPFFGDGTLQVITSAVSKAFPVSDAGLGALAYSLEVLMGFKGGSKRWRTMPWIVIGFAILIVPVGFTSVVLITLQPILVHAWCSYCLLTAFFMLIMIALTVDEAVAALQFLSQQKRMGRPFWRTFWFGAEGGQKEVKSPSCDCSFASMVRGVTIPWNLALTALIGVFCMFVPALFLSQARAADFEHIIGALVVVFSIISMAEVTRSARFLNIIFGALLFLIPFLFTGSTPASSWCDTLIGIALILLSWRRGKIKQQYGSWDKAIL